jgi:hypothetical protein
LRPGAPLNPAPVTRSQTSECRDRDRPLPGGSGEVALKNGARLEVSRRRYRELLQALAGPD